MPTVTDTIKCFTLTACAHIKIYSNCIAVQSDDDRQNGKWNEHWNATAPFQQCQKGKKNADLYYYSIFQLTGWTEPAEVM